MRLSTEAKEDEALPQAPAFGIAAISREWRVAGIWTLAAILGILLIHLSTVRSFLRVWHQDRAFAHCYFIPPIAGYMIWLNRERLAQLQPKPSFWGLAIVILGGAMWFLSTLAQVQFGAQFALVVMVVGAIWAVLGGEVSRQIAYPLAFLFLAVPFGEAFFPILINIAGHLAVWMIAPLGAPIALDGKFVRLPGAEWTIAEACGGLRFILALLAVGALYAYTTYRKPWKRALFLVACLFMAVLTNGVRVSAILLIGYFTDMKSSIVHKHTWLGWLLFAIMALALFFIGRRWSDPDEPPREISPGPARMRPPSSPARRSFLVSALSALAIVAAWNWGASAAERPAGRPSTVTLRVPAGSDGWEPLEGSPWNWSPYYKGARASIFTAYQKGNQIVSTYVAYYRDQSEGLELIHAGNGIVDPDQLGWKMTLQARRMVPVGGRTIQVLQTDIRSADTYLRVWRWYRVAGEVVTSPVQLKLLTLRSKLAGQGDDAAVVVLAAPIETDPEQASDALKSFLGAMLPQIEATLRGPARNPGKVVN